MEGERNMTQQIGPNVRRLIVRKMALLAIPVGSGKESFSLGLDVITNREKFSSIAAQASDWVRRAIKTMKTAPDNPYGDDDEAIAGAILEGIEQREKEMKP
jgi:hypothetical protein